MTIAGFVFRLYRVFDLLLVEIREALIVLRGGHPYLPDIITSIHFFKVLGERCSSAILLFDRTSSHKDRRGVWQQNKTFF